MECYLSRGLRIYCTHKYELASTNTIVYAQCQSEGLVCWGKTVKSALFDIELFVDASEIRLQEDPQQEPSEERILTSKLCRTNDLKRGKCF